LNDQEQLADLAEQQGDHYAEHLAEVNETIDVITTEDVVNEKGVLVARAGTQLNRSVAKRIIQHKLTKPLEEQVRLEKSLSGTDLYQHFENIASRYPDIKQVNDALEFEQQFKSMLIGQVLHPFITQKLTVLQQRMPTWFEKGIFCGWLGMLIAREIGLNQKECFSALLAGLIHDVGFLHIDPEILNKKTQLTPTEWRSIQCHVVIGHTFLVSLKDLDSSIATAVLEHHERCDGTGYPIGREENSISITGRIIGLADSLQAIRVNQFEKCGRTLQDTVPYLQMNDLTYTAEVYRAIRAILKKANLQQTCHNPHASMKAYALLLRKRSLLLKQCWDSLVQITNTLAHQLDASHDQVNQQKVTRISLHVLSKISSAGMAGEEMASWLDECTESQDLQILIELNKVEIMQNEIIWQLNNLQKTSNIFLEALLKSTPSSHEIMAPFFVNLNEQLKQTS